VRGNLSRTLLLLLFALGCSGEHATAATALSGEHQLVSIDGVNLPTQSPNGDVIEAGRLVVSAQNSVLFEQTLALKTTPVGSTQVIQRAFYVMAGEGSSVVLRSIEYPVNDTASVDGGSIVLSHHADANPRGATQRYQFRR
jgi:hypothetical protein